MKWKQLRVWLVAFGLVSKGFCNAASSTDPAPLDLSPFFWERFITPDRTNMELISVTGTQTFDGLPFQVDGRACLYGIDLARQRDRPASDYPDIIGVKVGRVFDELHLLHATQFTDREQEVVAKARLNYGDGTKYEFPLAYGVHVRDWQRMHSEEKEVYTDPNTKVIWRGPGVARFKSTTRMSKTTLINPFPGKVVSTIDFVSTGKVASYDIAAATVSMHDSNRPVTPAVPIDRPDKVFDASLVVRVTDEGGKPIENVLVGPNISAGGSPSATVSTPVYTDSAGLGRVRYPKADSSSIYFCTFKDGWHRLAEDPWVHLGQVQANGNTNEIIVTIRMSRDAGVLVTDAKTGETTASGTATNALATTTTSQVPPSPLSKTTSTIPGSDGSTTDFHPHPILTINFPAGSKVRVEAADNIMSKAWDSVIVITNLPTSPYPFICGDDCSHASQRFYRAVLVPKGEE